MDMHEGEQIEGKLEIRGERWHVGKEIPIAVIVVLLVQTAGIVWWAATVSGKLDMVAAQVNELRAERYTKFDAQRDQALTQQRIGEVERRVTNLENRR